MRRSFWAAALAVCLLAPVTTWAADFKVGEQPTLSPGQEVSGDLYLAGSDVSSAGHINGDVIATGGNILLDGEVNADALILGGNITITGDIGDDLRVAGGTVVVQSQLGGDVLVAGGQITLGGPGIGGDVFAAGGVVRINAPVAGQVRIGAGQVYIDAPINGDVTIEAGTVTLGEGAVINGSLTYAATEELTLADGAQVNGDINFTPRAKHNFEFPRTTAIAIFSAWSFGKFLALLVGSLVLGLSLKRFSGELVKQIKQRPWSNFGIGIVVLFGLPLLSTLALFTVIGAPLGILGWLASLAMYLTAWLLTPLTLGSLVYALATKKAPVVSWRQILLGTVIFTVIGWVPFLGCLFQWFLMLFTLGAMASIKWGALKRWH